MIVFDVGANDGSSCYHYSLDLNNVVYAFEPTPFILEVCLLPKQSDNYIVVNKAISDYDGEAIFNIAGQCDWGCSSLNEFSEGLDVTWPGRIDFKVTDMVTVKVTRIDSFMEERGIKQVDYLHCDTQGNDLKVLKSFGKYLNSLGGGTVEACRKNPLYKNVDNSEESIVSFLLANNFEILSIISNDYEDAKEVNISFKHR